MDAAPAVTDEEVAMGMVDFCTPAPRAEKKKTIDRRRCGGD